MTGTPDKNKKGKKKIVFAKSKKEAIAAIVVVTIFILNGIYLITKNIIDQMPTTPSQNVVAANQDLTVDPSTLAQSQNETTSAQLPANDVSVIPTDTTIPATVNESTTDPMAEIPNQASIPGETLQDIPNAEQIDYTRFVMPICIVIFLVITSAAIMLYKKNAKKLEMKLKGISAVSGKKNLSLAKDEKQAIAAIIVVCLFISNSIYLVSKNIIDQMPVQTVAQAPPLNQKRQMNEDIIPVQNSTNPQDISQEANDIYSQTMAIKNNNPNIQTSTHQVSSSDDVEIMVRGTTTPRSGKMVSIPVTISEQSNPFLPASENVTPSSLAYLTAPPETLPTNSDAGKVMTTVISGILYDKYNPSAIINIEGTDYLVKKGDLINRYKVLSITKNQVLVQLGKNIYKAGVGELLSQTDLNYNTIANLNKKFGGNEIPINVKKK